MKAKKVAVIICNFNKKEYVKKNIYSLKKQSADNFDIYVVDNASTDGSIEEIRNEFKDEVRVIRNDVNLGGSGGFNTGLRLAMEKGYPYILLLDNDVVLKENCIETLYTDMEENTDIGIMGAKILKMDYPDIIQEFAPSVNYETMTFELNHGGERDDGSLPHFEDCDYVPACAMIIRSEVIDKIGYMPEENFIYYDDITWGVRCHRAGYRVVANSHAAVWHKGGALINPTTFGTYYLNRNKLCFFMTYMGTESRGNVNIMQVNERIEHILLDVFEGIYSCEKKGLYNVAKTRMDAFLDALEGVTGKAGSHVIREKELVEDKFESLVREVENVLIYVNGNWENTRRILNQIYIKEQEWGKELQVELVDKHLYEKARMLGHDVYREPQKETAADYDLVFHVCRHIYELEIREFDHMWVDGWRNCILDAGDYENYRQFLPAYKIFKICFEDRVREVMRTKMEDIVCA